MKEYVCNNYCSDDTSQVGEQTAGNSVTGVLDADRAEVNGKNVESSVGGTLENTTQTTNE